MNRRKCLAVFRYRVISSLMAGLVAFTFASSYGDETQIKENDARLDKQLQKISNQELLAIVEGASPPAAIGAFEATPERLNVAVMAELARRLDPNLDKSKIMDLNSASIAKLSNPEPIPATDVDLFESVSTAETSTDPLPAQSAEVRLANVVGKSSAGEPFAVGMLELEYEPGHGPIIYPDQPLFLDSTDQRARYFVFDLSYQLPKNKLTHMVDRIRVSFLLHGSDPCQVSLASGDRALIEKHQFQPFKNREQHAELLHQWWTQFSVIPTGYGLEQKELKESLLDILARRLQLPGPWPKVTKADDGVNETTLEHQFEHGIGMLFGIESVKLAMRADTALSQSGRFEQADQSIPVRPVLPSVVIPQANTNTWIEPIAMRVPAECFYLRTSSLANYRQFRQFLVGWGGSLNDIVSTDAVNHQSRERIEGQLGISPDQFSTGEFDKTITDMALIGCDPMFDDGASIGILFHARNSDKLASALKRQRNQARTRVPESDERRMIVDGHDISFLASNDNRVRSFYAIDGDFHLVTNSYHLLSRFLQVNETSGSLGSLNEFRYAREQTNQIGKKNEHVPVAMLYLSDPFFQNLISPHYRIELTRRRQAARELKQYHVAMLVAKGERIHAETTAQLIDSGLLPSDFGIRPDGSHPTINNGKPVDSRRGALGYFLPIPDVPLQKATQTEVSSYNQFVWHYSQEWRRVDPVTVVFSRGQNDKDGFQQVGLDIIITPYAQQRYSLLTQYLAPANRNRVLPMSDDLVSLDTSIRAEQGLPNSHLLYVGLRDEDVPYLFKNGQIELADRSKGRTFAKSNSYAAISPPSTSALQGLASAFSRIQRKQDVQIQPTQHTRAASQPVRPTGGFNVITFFAAYMFVKSSDVFQYANYVSSNKDWMVASVNQSIRQDALEKLSRETIDSPSQVRLRVKSLNNSKVEPYIQAYTYLASRKASSENASFLNEATNWLQLPIKESRETVESVLGAQLRCPLGGDFVLSDPNGRSHWAGTEWPETSYYTETKTPQTWKFSFLDWLRELNLRFDIDQTTLRAHIDMLVHQPVGDDEDDQWTPLKLQGNGTPLRTVGFNKTPVFIPAEFQAMPTWVLGVQVHSGVQPLQVASVYPYSPASLIGLSVGDQILAIDRVKPESSEHLTTLLRTARDAKGAASIQLQRKGTRIELEIPLRTR